MLKAILLVFLFGIVAIQSEERLIRFNESYTVWMSTEQVEKLSECGGISPVHFMDITDNIDLSNIPVPTVGAIPVNPTQEAIVNPLLPKLLQERLRSTITSLSSYTNRYYTSATGVTSSDWLFRQYQTIANGHPNIIIEKFTHSWQQPSIIARISGTGSKAGEIVIIGGHIDTTANTSPGADDDASGSATVLEIFRVLVESGFKPQRSIEFHGYAAEEVGLRGSQAIAQQYKSQGARVFGMLQLDMTGYIKAGTRPTVGVVTDYTSKTLTPFLTKVAQKYIDTTTTTVAPTTCGYACSDHGSWNSAGYDACFAFESLFSNSNPNIHKPGDLINILNLGHAMQFAKLGLAFAIEMSNAP